VWQIIWLNNSFKVNRHLCILTNTKPFQVWFSNNGSFMIMIVDYRAIRCFNGSNKVPPVAFCCNSVKIPGILIPQGSPSDFLLYFSSRFFLLPSASLCALAIFSGNSFL
jgi:hypothetical protein